MNHVESSVLRQSALANFDAVQVDSLNSVAQKTQCCQKIEENKDPIEQGRGADHYAPYAASGTVHDRAPERLAPICSD
ncbi:hypothetical protein [Acinetobacter baumannii]|uniref:Uncharacterized protein n=1 Tax=Escherichia coli TaxID=562 RepID=A0A2P9E9K2_ECOLX|nr:protein of unknown function [Escherichia coli]SPD95660.1 protein of unknown function [Escherichia coli]SPD96034.1 protein of unknown function [Escherichia coli]SPD96533.1 protein of unknown function [Escherichia coli]SPD97262.1 protein of unknown function [Escherichia coli]